MKVFSLLSSVLLLFGIIVIATPLNALAGNRSKPLEAIVKLNKINQHSNLTCEDSNPFKILGNLQEKVFLG